MAHIYLIGASGSGKSTLLKQQFLDAIATGAGAIFIDPHGHDTDELLSRIPPDRVADVILFDPSDYRYPIAWNPLASSAPTARIAAALETAIKDASGYGKVATPTMRLYLLAAVSALIEANEPLLGLPFMFTAPTYRERVLKEIGDPLITRFWRDFETLSVRDKRQETNSSYNKAFAILLDRRIRHILGQTKTAFHVSDALDGKIILARLPQGQLGLENVKVLGILLLTQFHLAALARTNTLPVHVFIDECHAFDSETMAEMLSGIRKYHVTLHLAHQYLAQLRPALRDAILGNSAEKYIFRVSRKDAEVLNDHLGPDNLSADLFALPNFTARLEKTEVKIQPLEPGNQKTAAKIRSNMRRNYARPHAILVKETDRYITEA